MPANSQQCLNDSIIDTERSHSEITGYSPLGFGHCCLGRARLTLSYQPTSACGGILWSHVYRTLIAVYWRQRNPREREKREERKLWRVRWDTQTLTHIEHTSMPMSLWRIGHKCHFSQSVKGKLLPQNASCDVPANLGILSCHSSSPCCSQRSAAAILTFNHYT